MKAKVINTQQAREHTNKKDKTNNIFKLIAIIAILVFSYKVDNPFVWFGGIIAIMFMMSDSNKTNDSDEEYDDMFEPDIAMVGIDPISTVIYGSLDDD